MLFSAYVRPSVCFGLEFVTKDRQLQRVNTRFFQWGRRLLMWPRGAPTAAVQGQLGWFDVRYSRLLSAAGLWARLLSISSRSVAADVARVAATSPGGSQSGSRTSSHGRFPSNKLWLRHVHVVLASHANAWYSTAVHGIETLHDYAQWQPHPSLHPVVYGRHVSPALARCWGLARCDHHPFCDGRSARHRVSFIALRTVPCENGGVLEPDPGNCSTCQRFLAPPQSPTVPKTLRTTYALLAMYALPLRHVKCDATDALRRTVVG